MGLVWIETYFNAAAIAGGVSVSLTRLAIWRVAILHLASIIPTMKVLKIRKFISSVGATECHPETYPASPIIISHSEIIGVRIRALAVEIDERGLQFVFAHFVR